MFLAKLQIICYSVITICVRNGATRKARCSLAHKIFKPRASELSSGTITVMNVFYYRVQILVMMRGLLSLK